MSKVKVQFRRKYKDGTVETEWHDWLGIGTFISLELAINAVETCENFPGQLSVVKQELGQFKFDGVYEMENNHLYQFRFQSLGSPWSIGLNDGS